MDYLCAITLIVLSFIILSCILGLTYSIINQYSIYNSFEDDTSHTDNETFNYRSPIFNTHATGRSINKSSIYRTNMINSNRNRHNNINNNSRSLSNNSGSLSNNSDNMITPRRIF